MKRIGFLGAYSILNTGDLVLGYATRRAIAQRVPGAEHVVLAPAFKQPFWQHGWGEDRGIDAPVRSIPPDASLGWTKGLDAVVIGGGGILLLDPQFRPFFLGDPDKWPAVLPAAWNGVGSQVTPWYMQSLGKEYALVKRCCQALRYVSVRNRTTERFVRKCGFDGEVAVVPDPALLLELPEDDIGPKILERAGVERDRFVIGISVGAAVANPRAAPFFRELLGALAAHARDARPRVELVLFPFGRIYGDDKTLEPVATALPGAKVIREPLGPLETWKLVGALDFHVCTRFHAMLGAFAQGVPFLVLDEYLSDAVATSKIRDFIVDAELEALYTCPFLGNAVAAKLQNALALARAGALPFDKTLQRYRQELQAHYDTMVRALAPALA